VKILIVSSRYKLFYKKLDKIFYFYIMLMCKKDNKGVNVMKKVFIYFLSLSFLLMMNGFHEMIAEAGGKAVPIGEMISKGKVQFETRANQWRDVEASHFPLFEGTRIRTENGISKIVLSKGGQIDLGPNGLIFAEQMERMIVERGSVEFRIPSSSDLSFKVGNLSIVKAKAFQASKGVVKGIPLDEDAIGSITIHPNGSVTVKDISGRLTVLDRDQTIVASLSPKDAMTFPAQTVNLPAKTMLAQVGKTEGAGATGGEFLGLSPWTWVGIGIGVAAVAGVVGYAIGRQHEEKEYVPICP